MQNATKSRILLTLAVIFLLTGLVGICAKADKKETTSVGGFTYELYYSNPDIPDSIIISGYTGTGTQVIVPGSLTYKGKTLPKSGGEMILGDAFKGKSSIKKIAIPDSITVITGAPFEGCTSLSELAIGDGVEYIAQNAFAGLPNLKTYRIGGKDSKLLEESIQKSGIGQDKDGTVYPGITVHTRKGSPVDLYIQSLNTQSKNKGGNEITLVYEDDPYSHHTVKPDSGSSSGSGPKSSNRENQKGSDGTPLGKGASDKAAEKYLQSYGKEKDPSGSSFSLLQLKATKVTKTSVVLKWKKVSGAKKYVLYGNKCGVKNKYLKRKTTTKTSVTMKKIGTKKMKKGTYYKFILVALDKNNNVISTSKTVHAATKGGKVGNSKSVITKAKKNKVSVKVKKKFKLAAKDKPVSSKLKVKHHRKIAYESTNKKIAAVNSKGVITGKKKGKCIVYAYAQNGVFCKIKVTVK